MVREPQTDLSPWVFLPFVLLSGSFDVCACSNVSRARGCVSDESQPAFSPVSQPDAAERRGPVSADEQPQVTVCRPKTQSAVHELTCAPSAQTQQKEQRVLCQHMDLRNRHMLAALWRGATGNSPLPAVSESHMGTHCGTHNRTTTHPSTQL